MRQESQHCSMSGWGSRLSLKMLRPMLELCRMMTRAHREPGSESAAEGREGCLGIEGPDCDECGARSKPRYASKIEDIQANINDYPQDTSLDSPQKCTMRCLNQEIDFSEMEEERAVVNTSEGNFASATHTNTSECLE
jgi:hypothetical protein